MEFVRIPKGTFMMGPPKDERGMSDGDDLHECEITRDFYLGKYPVTQEQYETLMRSNPSYCSRNGEGKKYVGGLDTSRFPVENVSWEDAVRYCEKLTETHGKGQRTFRLPTEAEWEYACRGGTMTAFYFGSSCNGTQANCNGGQNLKRTSEVGSYASKSPHPWGLCDMHGNVWQWCLDWYDTKYYKNSPKRDPQSPESGLARVKRGGSWDSDPWVCRAAFRGLLEPRAREGDVGFRVAFRLD